MSSAYVLVWLGPAAAQAAFQPDLDSWAHARWTRLESAQRDTAAALAYDDRLVEKIGAELEEARVAAGSLDFASMARRLGVVEQTLRAHPELPQAAWLMAERLQIEVSAIADSNPVEAKKLEARARSLEGARAPAFGSTAGDSAPPLATERVELQGLGQHDRVYIDGRVASRSPTLVPGEHHARVLRRGRAVWAGWLKLSAEQPVRVPVPPPVACGKDDLGTPRITGDRVKVGKGVLCSRWIVARPRVGGGIEVASCSGSWCGALMPWTRRSSELYSGPPQGPRKDEGGLPTWAGWLIAGASAAAVTGVALWQTGAFDDPEPGDKKWTFTGPGTD
jgi:hypothetical protein